MACKGLKFKMQSGGMVTGPSHEQGGVPVVDESGTPATKQGMPIEVEGGERLFSTQDTGEIEQYATRIFDSQDEQEQTALATELGFRVAEMVMKQEQINPSE